MASFNVSIKGLQHNEAKQKHTVSSATLIFLFLRKQKETICNQKVHEILNKIKQLFAFIFSKVMFGVCDDTLNTFSTFISLRRHTCTWKGYSSLFYSQTQSVHLANMQQPNDVLNTHFLNTSPPPHHPLDITHGLCILPWNSKPITKLFNPLSHVHIKPLLFQGHLSIRFPYKTNLLRAESRAFSLLFC